MKIDIDYLKGLLEAFQAAEAPTTDIEELKNRSFDYEDKNFVFHFQLLADRGLIRPEDGDDFGYVKGVDGLVSWGAVPIRLTADGHDFIEALLNKQVWETLKANFKDAALKSLIDVSKQLLEGYVKKKLSSLLDQ